MISFEEYRDIVSELMDELPDEFFRELSGGVVASEATVIPDYAQGNDLFTLGKYLFTSAADHHVQGFLRSRVSPCGRPGGAGDSSRRAAA